MQGSSRDDYPRKAYEPLDLASHLSIMEDPTMASLNPTFLTQRRSSRRFGSLLLLPLVVLGMTGPTPDSFGAEQKTSFQQAPANPNSDAKSRLLRIGTMSHSQRNEVQALITRAVQDRLQAAQKSGKNFGIRTVHARMNSDDMLIIDIKRSELPKKSETIPVDILDTLDELAKSIIYLLDPDLYVGGYSITIDGHPASEVMPELPNPQKSSRSPTSHHCGDRLSH
jgi:hypothetical protein